MMNALFEAHSHDNMLDAPAFWKDIQDAVTALSGDDADAPRRCSYDRRRAAGIRP